MSTLELFTQSIPETGLAEVLAERAEAEGWDGLSLTDSQNLVGDPFVAMALGARATERLRFMTGVTNPATRHPAALATAVATVQEVSGGRAVLGIGRGDTALFHLGRPPLPLRGVLRARRRAPRLPAARDRRARERPREPAAVARPGRGRHRCPLDIAASGPKVIAYAARTAERVTFAIGADPDRMAWALDAARRAMRDAGRADGDVSFGAYVNVGVPSRPRRGSGADPRRHRRVRALLRDARIDRSRARRRGPDRRGRGRVVATTATGTSRTRPTTLPRSPTSSSTASRSWATRRPARRGLRCARRARARPPRAHRAHDRRRPDRGAGAPRCSSARSSSPRCASCPRPIPQEAR